MTAARSRPSALFRSPASARPRPAHRSPGRHGHDPQECLYPLLGRLHGHREVANGVWIARSPAGTPRSIGARTAARAPPYRDDVLSERRLRYPMKLVDGRWNRLSWNQAIDEIGDKLLEIRAKSGPESVYWLAQPSSPTRPPISHRKFAASGNNTSDHQARICNSHRRRRRQYVGLRRDDQQLQRHPQRQTIMVMGASAEAHPVSLQHILEGKELTAPT